MQLSNSLTPKSISSSSYLLRQYDGAAAAYSLQRLDSSTENVVRARRSTDDAEADFTAQEVSGGSLREFSLNNDADLIRFANQASAADKRMYFDGSNDNVSFADNAVFDLPDYIDIRFKFMLSDLNSFQVLVRKGSGFSSNYVIDTNASRLRFYGGDGASYYGSQTTGPILSANTLYVCRCLFDGTNWKIFLDGVEEDSVADAVTLATNASSLDVGHTGGSFEAQGIIYDLEFYDNTETRTFAANGYGNTNGDWEDQVGSNDGTVVGSPALFSGQGFDAFVTTLYDQSGALGQPLSRFAQHATSADKRMYFDGVNDDVQFAAFDLRGAVIRFTFLYVSGEAQILQMNDNANSGNLIAITLNSISDITVRLATVANAQLESYVFDSLTENTLYDLVITIASDGNSIDDATLNGLSGSSSTQTGRTQGTATANQLHLGIREDGSFPYTGLIYGVSVDGLHQWNGYGNTSADWEDQVGSNDGTVNGSPSIYEGRNALQSTASSQPQIVADGVVVTDSNGNPAITHQLEDSDVGLDFPIPVRNTYFEAYITYQAAASQLQGMLMSDNTNASGVLGVIQDGSASPTGATVTSDTYRKNGAAISSPSRDDLHTQYHDGAINLVTTHATINDNAIWDGDEIAFLRYGGSTAEFSALCIFGEIVVYASDQSANRAAIEANIASRYGITLA